MVACLVAIGLPNDGIRTAAGYDQTVFPADSPLVPTEFSIPTSNANSFQITGIPGGNFAFCEFGGNKIGRVTPSGAFTELPLAPGTQPYGITSGPDGNVWFTETGTKSIARITPVLEGASITEFPLSAPASTPFGITNGNDGNLWFTGANPSVIGRITPAGAITVFSIPGSAPFAIAPGPDGKIWFTQPDDGVIGKINTSGETTQYPLPDPNSKPAGITPGPDSNMWFTEYHANKIGRVSRFGVFNEYPIQTDSKPFGIVAAGYKLIFTQQAINAVGQFDLATLIFGSNIPTSAGPSGIASLPGTGPNLTVGYIATDANKVGFFTLSVTPPNCSVNISPTQQSFDARSRDYPLVDVIFGRFNGQSKCEPTAGAPWIIVGHVHLVDNEAFIVGYHVLENDSAQPRSGYIKVGDKFFSVDQAGATPLRPVNPTPRSVPSGGPGFKVRVNPAGGNSSSTITIEAAGFTSNSIVGWNGEGRPTTLVSGTELSADISADDIATPGPVRLTVFDPSLSGGTSPDVTLTITVGPDFSLGFDQSTVTAQAGTKARVTVNITRTGGFTGNVTVTPPDPAGGIKAKPADPITTTDTSASFKLKIGGSAAPGPHQLVFKGKDDTGRERAVTLTLVVQ